jgi:hypothetical protein
MADAGCEMWDTGWGRCEGPVCWVWLRANMWPLSSPSFPSVLPLNLAERSFGRKPVTQRIGWGAGPDSD